MATWLYSGKSASGKDVQGQINASNKDEAKVLLRKKRILVQKFRKKPMELSLNLFKGVPVRDLARFTRQFSAMNSSGLPLIQCLDTLSEQEENKVLKKAVEKISLDVQGGATLSESFSKHGAIFSDLYCHMLAAGEAGGILDVILFRLAEYQEKTDALIRKIKKAMYYPIFVLVISIAVVVFLLVKVVPIFAEMFQSVGGDLPTPTKIVLQVSGFFQEQYALMTIILAIGAIVFKKYVSTPKGEYAFDKMLLTLPIFGVVVRKSSVSRFTRTLGTLLGSGVPIIEALRITSKTAGNKVVEGGILKAVESITGGHTIAEPLKETGIFPSMVIQMIAIGEKTGGLAEMLDKVSEFFENEVDAAVDGLTSLIEPLIIVFLGVFIGAILIAMYLPMFDMASNVG